jgi:hypothetical protein
MDQRRRRLRRRHLAHGELRAWGLEVLVVLETEPLLLLLLLMQLLEGILFGLFVDCVGAVRTYFGAPKHMCELLKRRRSSFASTTDFSSGSPSPSEVGSVVICGGPIIMLACCFLGAEGMLPESKYKTAAKTTSTPKRKTPTIARW